MAQSKLFEDYSKSFIRNIKKSQNLGFIKIFIGPYL